LIALAVAVTAFLPVGAFIETRTERSFSGELATGVAALEAAMRRLPRDREYDHWGVSQVTLVREADDLRAGAP
jgi:hypothetical protein